MFEIRRGKTKDFYSSWGYIRTVEIRRFDRIYSKNKSMRTDYGVYWTDIYNVIFLKTPFM